MTDKIRISFRSITGVGEPIINNILINGHFPGNQETLDWASNIIKEALNNDR